MGTITLDFCSIVYSLKIALGDLCFLNVCVLKGEKECFINIHIFGNLLVFWLTYISFWNLKSSDFLCFAMIVKGGFVLFGTKVEILGRCVEVTNRWEV